MRYDLTAGFPLITTKKVHTKSGDLRAAVVPARRLECAMAAGTRRQHLGRMGFGEQAILGPVYGRAVAFVADGRRVSTSIRSANAPRAAEDRS